MKIEHVTPAKAGAWQPVGLKGNWLQTHLIGPDFAVFLSNRMTIALR
jgi:hypothetical protein